MTTGIYKITNKIDGKVYIGQSLNCEKRLQEHKRKRPIPIDMWINMLGAENFTFEIIEKCKEEDLDREEQKYIQKYDSQNGGYNIQDGGYNNSIGSGNGRAQVNEEDVKIIRKAYAEHKTQKETYKQFEGKITFSQFQAIWQGRSWSHITPEVFSQENKDFYTFQRQKEPTLLTKAEVLLYRKMYVNMTRQQVYEQFVKDKGFGSLKKASFMKILTGDVRPTSFYSDIPVYKKQKKQWLLQGQPVQTILESEE